MEYIFLVIAMLICVACVLAVFLEAEKLERTVIYEKGDFIKFIKYRNGKKVDEKIFYGKKADILYKILG